MPKSKMDDQETGGEEPPAKKLRQPNGDEMKDGIASGSEVADVQHPQGEETSIAAADQTSGPTIDSENATSVGGSGDSSGVEAATTSKGEKEEKQEAVSCTHTLEVDVGITEYISSHRGINAIIKQRYSDFIVNEISLSGEEVHLTSTDLPEEEDTSAQEEASAPTEVDPILSEEVKEHLKTLAGGADPKQNVSIPVGDDKAERQRIHQAVKKAFPTLETRTEELDGQKVITAMHRKAAGGRDGRRQGGQHQWPASKSKLPYCRFVLYKENKDTMDAISLIAKFLKVKPGLFQYAGTKDRRAKTSQEITAQKVHPKKLRDLNLFLRNIVLGNFKFAEKPLKLGQLSGNRFTIVLRNVVGEEEDLEKGLKSLQTSGFINYFGMQRFGTMSVPTHHVGRALLRENWEEAVNLILSPGNPKVVALSEKFRRVWGETKDPQQAVDATEPRHNIERTVLRFLCRSPGNWNGAIQALPRNTRMLYVHSYQSYVWNRVASRRIKERGLVPVPGDLVLPPGADSAGQDEDDAPKVRPVVLDDESVPSHTIYDVLLPLPGHDISYPGNEVHDWYKCLLAEDGFDIDNMQRKQKDFSLPGGYRNLMVRPTNVEWQSFQYDDYTLPLALSDQDKLSGEKEPVSLPDGRLKAVSLSLTLPSSSYATMALREVLKADTSPAHQTSLNTA